MPGLTTIWNTSPIKITVDEETSFDGDLQRNVGKITSSDVEMSPSFSKHLYYFLDVLITFRAKCRRAIHRMIRWSVADPRTQDDPLPSRARKWRP